MNRIKILYVLEATAGGTRRYINELLDRIDLEQFMPVLAASIFREPDFKADIDRFIERGISVEIVPMRREISPLSDIRCLLRLIALVRKHSFDIVHTHSSKAGVLGRIAARVCGIKTVIHTPHVFPFDMETGNFRKKLYLKTERWVSRYTTMLITVCEHEKHSALNHNLLSEEKIKTVYNGVDTDYWTGFNEAGISLRKSLNIDPNAVVVGMAGRFTKQKGHEILIRAFVELVRLYPDIILVLTGNGELKEHIRGMVKEHNLTDNVMICDQTDDIAAFYAMFNILVMPSLWEAMPFTLLEAMSMRVPVVASSAGGIPEVIDDGENGIIVHSNRPEDVTEAIKKLIDDPSLINKIGEKAREKIVSEFQLSNTINQLQSLYTSSVNP